MNDLGYKNKLATNEYRAWAAACSVRRVDLGALQQHGQQTPTARATRPAYACPAMVGWTDEKSAWLSCAHRRERERQDSASPPQRAHLYVRMEKRGLGARTASGGARRAGALGGERESGRAVSGVVVKSRARTTGTRSEPSRMIPGVCDRDSDWPIK